MRNKITLKEFVRKTRNIVPCFKNVSYLIIKFHRFHFHSDKFFVSPTIFYNFPQFLSNVLFKFFSLSSSQKKTVYISFHYSNILFISRLIDNSLPRQFFSRSSSSIYLAFQTYILLRITFH